MAAAPQLHPKVVHLEASPLRAASSSAWVGGGTRRRALTVTDEAGREQRSVLVVEPDERTRSVLEVGLAREGFDVIAAETAEEALRFIGPAHPLPGMVFSEADLRGSDGFSFCSTIRADQRTADLPVVLLSRTAEAWHRELAGGSGADQYLPKPVFLNDVVALARLMTGRSSWAAKFPAETAQLPIAQALRAILSGVRSGRVELEDGSGWLSFRDGCVVDACFENARGGEGLRRLLLLGKGTYTVSFGPALARANLTFGLEDLCGRTYQQVQRWTRLLQDAVPLESVLVVDFARLIEELGRLPDQVNEIVRLCDGRRTVRDVIIECTLDEVTALEAVMRLHAMQLLVTPSAAESYRATAESFFALEPVTPLVDALDPALQRQLDAFRIQEVVDAPPPRVGSAEESPDLSAFTKSGGLQEAVSLAAAVEAEADMEARFFTEPERGESAVGRGGGWLVVAAVLFSASLVLGAVIWKRLADRPAAPAAPAAAVGVQQTPEQVEIPEAPTVLPAIALVIPAETAAPVEAPVEARPAPEPAPEPESVAVEARPNLTEGIALYDAGNLRQAAAILDGVTRRDPKSAQAWVYLGLARFDLGDAAAAETAAMKAIELEPKNGRALILLASVYLTAGQQQKAEVELRRYLELEPNGPYATDARQLLAR